MYLTCVQVGKVLNQYRMLLTSNIQLSKGTVNPILLLSVNFDLFFLFECCRAWFPFQFRKQPNKGGGVLVRGISD